MPATREQDEAALFMVRRRASGVSANQIAKSLGRHAGVVVIATNGVVDADLAESGEDPGAVASAYWARGA